MANLEFFDALYVAGFEKNNLPLSRLLRANYSLSAQEKASLADFLEGKIKPKPGRKPWKATDELTDPDGAAVRRGAYFFEIFLRADKAARNPAKDRQKRAIRKAFEYMEKKGLPYTGRESSCYFSPTFQTTPQEAQHQILTFGADDNAVASE